MDREVTLIKIFLFLLGIILIDLGLQGKLGSGLAAIFAPQALKQNPSIPSPFGFGGGT